MFNDGWQYSNGCAFEFVEARKAGLLTDNTGADLIGVDVAIAMVGDAIQEIAEMGITTDHLQEMLCRLEALTETAPTKVHGDGS